MKPIREYLADILQYITDIEDFTQPGEADFRADRKTQLAVIRAYEVIGEIVKRLPQEMLDIQPEVDWKAIKGFRDLLIHQYDNIDLAIVWSAVEKLPALRTAIKALLESLSEDDKKR
jgi:uncharacterized protein with HEPN domain